MVVLYYKSVYLLMWIGQKFRRENVLQVKSALLRMEGQNWFIYRYLILNPHQLMI